MSVLYIIMVCIVSFLIGITLAVWIMTPSNEEWLRIGEPSEEGLPLSAKVYAAKNTGPFNLFENLDFKVNDSYVVESVSACLITDTMWEIEVRFNRGGKGKAK